MNNTTATYDVCVLIPCYNNLPGLLKSLQSITYKQGNLCVLVVDDGSTVPLTKEAITNYFQPDFEVIVIRNPQNSGITKTLNNGLKYIEENLNARFIARLDCGDICHPDRFKRQVNYLNKHPEIGLLGSWAVFESADGSHRHAYITPTMHQSIIDEMHLRNVFIHPAVMFPKSILKTTGYYPENYPHVEDYAFFMKIAQHFKTAVIPEILVTCEINVKGISIQNRKKQLEGRYRVVSDFGNKAVLKAAGLIKLKLLMLIPYKFILMFKNIAGKM